MRKASIQTLDIPKYRITLINCCDIIQQQEINIINDLNAIDAVVDMQLGNRDTKRIFYYHIIKGFCEYISASRYAGSHVFYYSSCDLKFLELTEYVDTPRLKQFLCTLTRHVSNLLPIKFYTSSECFNHISNDKSGESQETVANILRIIKQRGTKTDSLTRVRTFLRDNEFKHLNEKYFSRYKQMMFFNK